MAHTVAEHGSTPLMAAIEAGDAAAVERLIPRSDVNAVGPGGFAALHLAAMSGRGDDFKALCIGALIEAGADAGQRVPKGYLLHHPGSTALHLAMRSSTMDSRSASLLLRFSDPDARSGRAGETPLMAAIDSRFDEFVPELLSKSDTSIRDKMGHTALMRAAQRGSEAVVRMIAPFSDVNAQTQDGWTALMFAGAIDRPEIVQALIPRSNAALRNSDGMTAADVAKLHSRSIGAAPASHSRCASLLDAHLLSHTERVALGSCVGPAAQKARGRSL